MNERPLAGKKIAVVVESQYIPAEINLYQERFAAYGARVDLVSRLWGQSKATFHSTFDPSVQKEVEYLDVTLDFEDVKLEDYAAVVVAANYVSVRLRWSEREDVTAGNAAEVVRSVPAAKFLQAAMRNPGIIKALPCHALWLLSPSPELIAGRRVLCNKVLLADVVNAGGIYTTRPGAPLDKQVVVDGDLVTTSSANATAELIDRVRDLIIDPPRAWSSAREPLAGGERAPQGTAGKGRVLLLLSEWGYRGEELVGSLEELDRAGCQVDVCTPSGRRPNAAPASVEASHAASTPAASTERLAAKARELDDPESAQGKRLARPLSLSEWFPERPYGARPEDSGPSKAYASRLREARRGIENYGALLIVGGPGAIVDLCNNGRVHDLILAFLALNKPVGADSHAVACLAFARDLTGRESILRGKHVTGHCVEHEQRRGASFVRSRNVSLDLDVGPPPYPLEYVLRDATGPDGGFHGSPGQPQSVIVDFPFVTGRSAADGALVAQKLSEMMSDSSPLRRWGW